jgi:hypothetical protein
LTTTDEKRVFLEISIGREWHPESIQFFTVDAACFFGINICHTHGVPFTKRQSSIFCLISPKLLPAGSTAFDDFDSSIWYIIRNYLFSKSGERHAILEHTTFKIDPYTWVCIFIGPGIFHPGTGVS